MLQHLLTAPYNLVIIRYLQHFSTPWLDRFFIGVTTLGEDYLFIMVIVMIFWFVNKEFGYRLGLAYLANGVINTSLKESFHILRPIGQPGIRSLHLMTASGYSFPSGHAQMATSFWISVITSVRRRWTYLVGVPLILLVSLSRLYLGVHRPVDVVAGMLLGVVCVLISNLIFDYAVGTGRRWILLLLVFPVLAGCYWYRTDTFIKVAGVMAGFVIGFLVESAYIHYQVRAPFPQQVMKLILGVIGLLIIMLGLKLLLPSSLPSVLFRYLLVGLWVTAGAPWLFQRICGFRR